MLDFQKGNTPLLELTTRRKHTKLVQVVQNFFTKTLQVIVQARSVPDSSQLPYGASDNMSTISNSSRINKWFNLHMPMLDSEWVKSELRPWKSHADLSQFPPMIIETVLDLRQLSACELVMLEDDHGGSWPVAEGGSKKLEVVLERWLIDFDQSGNIGGSIGGNRGGNSSRGGTAEELPLVYKQAIVLLRVIYGIVRLLPAYKLRKLVGKQANKNLSIRNRFIDGKQPVNSKGRIGLSKSIVPHQMLVTESHMMQREFTPIYTSAGVLRVSVAYRNHHKFQAQDQEARLSSHFLLSDTKNARESIAARGRKVSDATSPTRVTSSVKEDPVVQPDTNMGSPPLITATTAAAETRDNNHDRKARRGSFGHFREKYSVLPRTSETQEKDTSPPHPAPRKHSLMIATPPAHGLRPSIQPFKVGSIGSSSPPYSTLASIAGSSMERKVSITSNRSGSNASLVALLRNPRGSTSSNTPNAVAIGNIQTNTHATNPLLPRSISSSHGSHLQSEEHFPETTSNTPRFSSSFGSRQSRRFSNASAKYPESNAYFGTSVELNTSSVPFSGLYADDDISSFVQMIDGTSELRLSNSTHESKLVTPNNESSTHFEALNRFQLLKSHYQHLSDSVNASLILQHHLSRSPLDDKPQTRRSSHSTNSPAPSLPVGSYENSHMPSINSRLSKFGDDVSKELAENKSGYRPNYTDSSVGNLAALPLTVTTIAHASHGMSAGSKKAGSGLATSPSSYESSKQVVRYEDVFEEDDEGIDYFASLRAKKHQPSRSHDISFDNDDMLFEMTDTK